MLDLRSGTHFSIQTVDLPSNKLEPLMRTLVEKGPIAVSVDASAWHKYKGGVFDGCSKLFPTLDHAVLLVGYGTDEKEGDYWLIRNTWGPTFGENGYIRIKRSKDEESHCGTDRHPEQGDGCDDSPKHQHVCGTCGILFDATFPM